ncbi:MAG TPA: response regulator [Nitrospirota bacterium]|nr:response regulator [Nitrospirota bacterium]
MARVMIDPSPSGHGNQALDRKTSYALLVDGYVRDLFATGMILQRLEYDVFIVNSGEDALRIIEAALPDLIITELSLQRMSGLELLINIKHDPATKAIPVIIHTAIGDQKREEHCRASGCAAFLKKPVEPTALYRAIQQATESMPRQYIRLRTLLPVRVSGLSPTDISHTEYVSELSENGIFVHTLNPRPVDAVLSATILLHSIPVKIQAVVVYSVALTPGLPKEPGMGMKFVEIKSTDREMIRNFIIGQLMKGIPTK